MLNTKIALLIGLGLGSTLAFAQSHMPPDSSGASSATPATQAAPSPLRTEPLQSTANPRDDILANIPPAAPITRVEPKTVNGVTYMCGGVGLEEAAYMKQQARAHDVLLTFATKRGNYLSDVDVNIKNARGEEVLTTTCAGPMMVLDLPRSGTYRIHAEAEGYELNKVAQVNIDRRAPTALVMTWPQRLAEGEPALPASTGSSGTAGTGSTGSSTTTGSGVVQPPEESMPVDRPMPEGGMERERVNPR